MPARVFTYGLLDPIFNGDLVAAEMRRAHTYHNKLVEIERERREAVRAALAAHPDVTPLEAAVAQLVTDLENLRDQIHRANALKRGRAETSSLREQVRAISAQLKEARACVRTAKDAIREDALVAARIERANDRCTVRVKEERKKCGTYWGTYILHEADIARAREEGAEAQFKRWTEEGRVSVQLQGGIAIDELENGTQVQLLPGRPLKDNRTVPPKARVLKMRVQSNEKGQPIWAEWPMVMHRPLPEDCRIKLVTVHKRRRDCRRWDWQVTFQVELKEDGRQVVPESGVLALNLGYTGNYEHLDGALRAGLLVDDTRTDREVQLPANVIDRARKSESIRSFRDESLNFMRAGLVEWLREHEATLPEWIVDRCVLSRFDSVNPDEPRKRVWHVALWRSPERFTKLAKEWREKRWDGDIDGYWLIEDWRYREEHLERYENGMRRHALLHRREVYRVLAKELAGKYRTLVVGSTDLRELQQSPEPEEKRVEIPAAKYQQRIAAGSELRGALINAFRGAVATVDDDRATIDCHACGNRCEWDRIKCRRHVCEHCGVEWDQDENYCKNLLKRFEQSGGVKTWETARTASLANRKETRSERLRRNRWKKKKEEETLATP